MMMVCASEESLDEQKQFTTDLVRVAQETGLHLHVIAHCRKPPSGDESKPPSKYDLRGSAAISDQAHNVITVWADKEKKARLEQDPNDMAWLAKPAAASRIAASSRRYISTSHAAALARQSCRVAQRSM